MWSASRRTSAAESRGSTPSANPLSTSLHSRADVANLCSGAIRLSSVLRTQAASCNTSFLWDVAQHVCWSCSHDNLNSQPQRG